MTHPEQASVGANKLRSPFRRTRRAISYLAEWKGAFFLAHREARESEQRKQESLQRRVATYIFFAVIALVPLPFGSVDPNATALWCVCLGVGTIALSVSERRFTHGHVLIFLGIAVLVCGYGIVLHEQLADSPWFAKPDPLWRKVSDALGVDVKSSASIVRGMPFVALGPTIANVLALICGLFVGTDYNRARQMMWVIALAGVTFATYGILSFLLEPTMLLWRTKEAYLGNLTGTFVNRNTAAAYFGSTAIVWFCLFLRQIRRELHGRLLWKSAIRQVISTSSRSVVLSFFGFFVCVMAMFLTGSRAGVLVSLAALVLTFTIFFRRELRGRGAVWRTLFAGAISAFILLLFMGDIVSTRLQSQGLADEGRLDAYRSTLRIIAAHPWFGTGLGTFQWSFPALRSSDVSMWGVWDIAHNTPLELASELGLPLALAVVFGWAVMIVILVGGATSSRRGRTVPLAALFVATIGLVHSCVDFTLQIPGFSIVAFGLVGVGAGWSLRTPEQSPTAEATQKAHSG